ncbi:TniQ family protein [Deinococcus sp. Marseille-Q6407]|uniref:TniQ family protein n=1 Tax=Deinococcus sp. Marseille-Q6407 TaxID=2969223 RepID=UPI00396578F5
MTLPVHPVPAPGGLLSDYLIRLALANSLRPAQLARYLNQPRLWQRDPDCHVPEDLLRQMDRQTGLPVGTLETTSMRALIRNLHLAMPGDTTLIRFITVTGRHTRVPGQYGHPVCPRCLAEGKPMRREWRLTTTVLCQEHGLALVDRCNHCGHAINHSRKHVRAGRTAQPLDYTPDLCGICQQGLQAPTLQDGYALWLQQAMSRAANGDNVCWGDLTLSSHEFAGITECLLRLNRPAAALRHPRWRPETAPIQLRLGMVSSTGHLMSGGLTGCLSRLQQQDLTPVTLLARLPQECVPHWFAQAVQDVLSRRPHARRSWQGPASFTFTEEQWEAITPLLPPEPTTGGGRAGRRTHRQVLENFLSRCAAGTTDEHWKGAVSVPTMRRRTRTLAQTGVLDRIIQVLLDHPTGNTCEVLSSPETVRQLRQAGCSEAEYLAQLTICQTDRRLVIGQSACMIIEAGKEKHGTNRTVRPSCNEKKQLVDAPARS